MDQGLTRINVKIKADQESEINGQDLNIDAAVLDRLFQKLDKLERDDVLIVSGSVPSTLPGDIYERILARLEGRGSHFVVDATRDLLCNVLPYYPFLIKPNNLELGEIFGRTLNTDEEIRDCAAQLQQRGVRNVLVSMAGDGSLLVDETGGCHRLGVPKGQVRNSVGTGDSIVVGFVVGLLKTGDYAYVQRLGTAAGNATAFSDGLATGDQIMALLNTF